MEDEEFEKYFETIEEIFSASDFEGSYGIFYDFPTDKRKAKLKEILEEIYNQGCSDGIDSIVNYEKGRG